MDFVVLGFGTGALAVLLGLTARDLGPFARRIPRDRALPWAEVARRAAWGRACRAGGLILALAGGLLCLVTGVTLLVRSSDSSGMRAVLVGIAVAVVGICVWVGLYYWRPSFVASAHLPARSPKSPSERTQGGRSGGTRRGLNRRQQPTTEDSSEPASPRSRANERRETDRVQRRGKGVRSARAGDPISPEGPLLGTLTVDAMGGLRRTPVSPPDYNEERQNDEPTARPDRSERRSSTLDRNDPPSRSSRDRRSS